MSVTINHSDQQCVECGAVPIPDGEQYCSLDCYGASLPTCPDDVRALLEHLYVDRGLSLFETVRRTPDYGLDFVRYYLIQWGHHNPDRQPCPYCSADAIRLSRHILRQHPDVVDAELQQRSDNSSVSPLFGSRDSGPIFSRRTQQRETSSDQTDNVDHERGPHCRSCGNLISKPYARTFGDGYTVDGCSECQSRTQRYSNNPIIDPEDEEREPLG